MSSKPWPVAVCLECGNPVNEVVWGHFHWPVQWSESELMDRTQVVADPRFHTQFRTYCLCHVCAGSILHGVSALPVPMLARVKTALTKFIKQDMLRHRHLVTCECCGPTRRGQLLTCDRCHSQKRAGDRCGPVDETSR